MSPYRVPALRVPEHAPTTLQRLCRTLHRIGWDRIGWSLPNYQWYRRAVGGHWEFWYIDLPMGPIWMHIEHGTRPGCGHGTPVCEDYDEAFFPELIPEREVDLIDLNIQKKKQKPPPPVDTPKHPNIPYLG